MITNIYNTYNADKKILVTLTVTIYLIINIVLNSIAKADDINNITTNNISINESYNKKERNNSRPYTQKEFLYLSDEFFRVSNKYRKSISSKKKKQMQKAKQRIKNITPKIFQHNKNQRMTTDEMARICLNNKLASMFACMIVIQPVSILEELHCIDDNNENVAEDCFDEEKFKHRKQRQGQN